MNRIIESDSQFLANHNLIDYSLLLAIEQPEKYSLFTIDKGNRNILIGSKGVKYHVSIIDFLQTFNSRKKFELNYRKCVQMKNMKFTSIARPDFYKRRFDEFMSKNVFGDFT